jgi:hypothetical protein
MAVEATTRRLLITGGVMNLAFGLFHLLLGWQIRGWTALPAGARGLMLALNVGGTLFIFFFAYAFLFCGKDLVTTRLGRATLAVSALLYGSRAAEEFFLFPFTPVIFATCLIAGAIPALLLATAGRAAAPQ